MVVATLSRGDTLQYSSCGEVKQGGDSAFGMLKNKWLNYGWMSCNTAINGHTLGNDPSGRALPLHIANKFVEIEVDCGRIQSGWARVATKFKLSDMDSSGNKGNVLYEFDGLMRIWAGRLSSDVKAAGQFTPITGDDSRQAVARQVLGCEARNN